MVINIIEQINYNLYSYSSFVVIGIIIFILYKLAINIIFKDINNIIKNIILFALAVGLPFCSCIAITFLLYETNEKRKILLYIFSLFIKAHTIVLINAYFGEVGMYSYIFAVSIIIIIYLCIYNLSKRICLNKDLKEYYEVIDIRNIKILLIYISKFIYIYFISIVIMSIIESFIPNEYIIKLLSNTDKMMLKDVISLSIIKYICMPNDLTTFASMVATGLDIKYLAVLILVGTTFNIAEIITIFMFVKEKILILIMIISNIISTLLFMFVITFVLNNEFSLNYDLTNVNERMDLVNALNINPSNLFRWISVIIILLFVAHNIYMLFNNVNNRNDC